jgi:ADP-ribosylglycohydrolase
MTDLSRFRGCLIGHAVANSLGAPYEGYSSTEARQSVPLGSDGLIIAPPNLSPYRDDLKMIICVAESICDNKRLVLADIMERFVDWYMSGDHRGMGITAEAAITRYMRDRNINTCGERGTWAAGNGAAMRVTPVSLFSVHADARVLQIRCAESTALTHSNPVAVYGAGVTAQLIAQGLRGITPTVETIDELLTGEPPAPFREKLELTASLVGEHTDPLTALGIIGTGGYIVETVCSAIFMAISQTKYEEAVTTCLLAGGDTDTVAGLVGAFIGGLRGISAIPPQWERHVEDRELLEDLSQELLELSEGPGRES